MPAMRLCRAFDASCLEYFSLLLLRFCPVILIVFRSFSLMASYADLMNWLRFLFAVILRLHFIHNSRKQEN